MFREYLSRFFTIFVPMLLAVGSLIVFRVFGMDHPVIQPLVAQVSAFMWNKPLDAAHDDRAAGAPARGFANPYAHAAHQEIIATQFRLTQRSSYSYSVPQIARGQSRAHDLVWGDQPLRFYSYHPRGNEPVPLVVLFHGMQRDGLSMIDMWRRTAMREGFALLAPDAPGRTWDLSAPGTERIHAMIDQLAEIYPIDRSQVYLFGHSAGAGFAKVLINGHDGPWQAAALHAGAVTGLPRRGLGKPVRSYIGDQDASLSLGDARRSMEALARNGSDSTLVVIPGHTHWFYDIGPQIADDAWGWFAGLGAQEVAAR